MISLADFRGGAEYQSIAAGTVTLYINSKRVQQIKNTSASVTTVSLNSIALRSDQLGGPRFYIVNDPTSTGNLSVSYKSSVTGAPATTILAPGEVGLCHGIRSDAWFVEERTIGTARAVGHGTRGAIVNPTVPKTFSPYCLEGSGCDVAESTGNVPLDGLEGRPLVVAPMFQNSALAKNEAREAIRGADIVMPSVVPIQFIRGEFEIDADHPKFATFPLSEGFFDALHAGDRWHAIPYLGTAHGISSHWHHVRWAGAIPGSFGWAMPNNYSVRRHVWEKLIVYKDATDTDRTLTIRVVLEHSVNAEPLLVPVGGGGQNDVEFMGWGSMIHVYVFTNEVEPTFVDDNTYTPVGSSGAISFTKNDPARWGGCVGQGANDKFCHPQMAICASLPTTFEAPAGSKYVPWQDRQWLKAFQGGYTVRGKNRAACYRVSNGAPWLSGSCSDYTPGGVGIDGNIVFGGVLNSGGGTTSYSFAAMTTGGDVPKSILPNFVIIENGGGDGRTLLRPLKPGWDEACGKLDAAGGSAISISFCTDDSHGIDDGTGRRFWPGYEVDSCLGHPDEPLGGIGGTHTCFHNNGTSCGTRCCAKLDHQLAGAYDYCLKMTGQVGDWNGSECVLGDNVCSISNSWWRQVLMELEDYDYVYRGNQDLRVASWRRDLPDPTQVFYNVVYAAADADWTDEIGTWDHGATLSVNTPGAQSVVLYEPAGHTAKYRDMRIVARGKKCKTTSHGVFVRTTRPSGTSLIGYVAQIFPTGGNNGSVLLRRVNGAVFTTLVSKNITNLTSETVIFDLEVWGSDLTFKWTVSGEAEDTLTATNCDVSDNGWPGLHDPDGSTDVEFDNIEVFDTTVEYVTVAATLAKNLVDLTFPAEARDSYGQCTGTVGDVNVCNSVYIEYTLQTQTTATYNQCRDVIEPTDCDEPGAPAGDNPTAYGSRMPWCCEGPWCIPADERCDDCPPPSPILYFHIWQRCLPSSLSEPKICNGITRWIGSEVVCD